MSNEVLSFDRVEANWTCSIQFVSIFVERTKFHEHVFDIVDRKRQQYRSNIRNFTINSFDIVAVFGNKVLCWCDIVACCRDGVAGVDAALVSCSADCRTEITALSSAASTSLSSRSLSVSESWLSVSRMSSIESESVTGDCDTAVFCRHCWRLESYKVSK